MSLNWTMLDDSKRPVPLSGEHIVMTVDKGAEVVLSTPEPGGSFKKLNGGGMISLTDQRLIFVSSPSSAESSFESLSIPLASILSTSFVQPTFSPNYLLVDVRPSPGGGLAEGTKVEVRLKDQGMFGFVSALEKVRERALFMKREHAMEDDLPVYSSPSTFASSGNAPPPVAASSSGNQPSEAPPGYDAA